MFGRKPMADLVAEARTRIPEIDPDGLAARMDGGVCLHIDVREPGEWANARIPGAILVPLGSLEPEVALRGFDGAIGPDDLDRPIVVSCARGNRSVIGADQLRSLGFTNVVSLRGGIEAWIQSGRAVEK
jgi:rhodanese-related sulfurtransferase